MNEKRTVRMNLSLTSTQYNNLCKMAKIANMKPITYATNAVLRKKIFVPKTKFFMELLMEDYRKQIGFSKLVLRDCDVTEEVERIAHNTIYDFKEKIGKLEYFIKEEDGYRRNSQEN